MVLELQHMMNCVNLAKVDGRIQTPDWLSCKTMMEKCLLIPVFINDTFNYVMMYLFI